MLYSSKNLSLHKKALISRIKIESLTEMINYLKVRLPLFLFFLILFTAHNSFSQGYTTAEGIKNIRVQQLGDADIQRIKLEMQKENVSIQALETLALANGMSPADFAILKSKLEAESPERIESNVEAGTTINENPVELDKNSAINKKEFHATIFGSEIFNTQSLSFEPNSSMATPANYVLGPGDELQIIVYGMQEFYANPMVNKEGKINIPVVGQLMVSGVNFEAAKTMIKKSCSRIYGSLNSGQSNISISVSKFRTVHVTIIGAKKPGNYAVSSLSTVFNALHVAGGPDDNGSYRNIELIRNNKVVRKIDIYKFLMNGDQSDNLNLQDNDLIRVPVYENRVKIEGKVKRPGIFELQANETFQDLLRYCSGFDESAYKANIKLVRNTDKELKIMDLNEESYKTYKPSSGDVFKVAEILNRFENKVSVKGSVFRPDDYAFEEGTTIADLIKKADGLTEDAFLDRALLIREKEDLTKEIVNLNLNEVLKGSGNLALRKNDELIITSIFDLQDNYAVTIGGQIRKGGTFPYIEKLTLFDLIIQAGGFTEAASSRVEISRAIRKDSILTDQVEQSEVITIDLTEQLKDPSKNMLLMPGDVVQIRKMPFYEKLETVTVEGAVYYPGTYVITNKNETILDVLKRTGGIDSEAEIDGIRVIRKVDRLESEKIEKISVTIPIDYEKIKRNPSARKNIIVLEGDVIVVPKKSSTVKVLGEVQLDSEIPFATGKGTRYYIRSVGGMNDNADRKKIYVIGPNGIAKSSRNFLFIRDLPRVTAGSEIVVPTLPKETKDKISLAEIASITGVVGSLSGLTVAIINLLSK